MKKYVLMTATILALAAAAGPASAQTAPAGATPSGPVMTAAPGQGFAEHKAEVLDRLQKRIACVQAAQNHEQLKACMPPPPGQGGPGGAPMGAPPQQH